MDITDNELVLTRALIETPKSSSKTSAATSYYSSYTPITESTYELSPINALPAVLTSS